MVCIYPFECMFLHPKGRYKEMFFLGHVAVVFTFLRNLHALSIRTEQDNIPSSNKWEFFPHHISIKSDCSQFYEVISHCHTDLGFPDSKGWWASFHVTICHFLFSEKCLFISFPQFGKRFGIFVAVELCEFFIYLYPLTDTLHVKIFSHSVKCPLILAYFPFAMKKLDTVPFNFVSVVFVNRIIIGNSFEVQILGYFTAVRNWAILP